MPSRKTQRISVRTVEGARPHARSHAPQKGGGKNVPAPKNLRRLWIILGGIVGGIVLLGAVFVFWAHGSVGRLVLAGKEYEVKSEFSKAREQYDLAIQLRIFNPLVAAEAFAAVADILIQKNQPDKAVDYYKAAIENAPQNSDIAIQASTVFLARNKLDFAEKAVKDFSDSLPGIQRIRANVALRKGNTAEAQNIFAANAAQDSESVYRQWILSLIAQNTSTVIRTDAESAATKIGKSEAFENISKAYDAVTKKNSIAHTTVIRGGWNSIFTKQ
jgi:tetratricopeptide (TPR) repeat protein